MELKNYKIIFSKKFIKEAKKITENNKNLKAKINFCIIDFSKNGRNAASYRKKLKGNLRPLEELKISGDIRIFIEIDEEKNIVVLERIGTHSQLGI